MRELGQRRANDRNRLALHAPKEQCEWLTDGVGPPTRPASRHFEQLQLDILDSTSPVRASEPEHLALIRREQVGGKIAKAWIPVHARHAGDEHAFAGDGFSQAVRVRATSSFD